MGVPRGKSPETGNQHARLLSFPHGSGGLRDHRGQGAHPGVMVAGVAVVWAAPPLAGGVHPSRTSIQSWCFFSPCEARVSGRARSQWRGWVGEDLGQEMGWGLLAVGSFQESCGARGGVQAVGGMLKSTRTRMVSRVPRSSSVDFTAQPRMAFCSHKTWIYSCSRARSSAQCS